MATERDWFNVSGLAPIEIDEPGVEIESNIIDWGEDFYLKVTFGGPHAEMEWHNMTSGQFPYQVQFYAHGVSPGTNDLDLGVVAGNLQPNVMSYEVKSPITNVKAEGLWECGAIVTFQLPNTHRYHGVLGFNHDCPLQVSKSEEPH